jgi:hypothetical protein
MKCLDCNKNMEIKLDGTFKWTLCSPNLISDVLKNSYMHTTLKKLSSAF